MNNFETLAQSEKGQVRITDVKVIQLKGHGIQSLVKVETDAGVYGIGEIGAPAVVARAYLHHLKPKIVGQDPLEIERLYAVMTRMQTQFHAHWVQNPTVSGVDIALWDIAGKLLNRPISTLLTGRFRDEIAMYINNGGSSDWFDPAACRDWAQQLRADPRAWRTIKIGFEPLLGKGLPKDRYQGGFLSQALRPSELRIIRQGYENLRDALGSDIDIIIHCHNEWDLQTAIGITEAVAPIKPLWVEDPLPVVYSDTYKALRQAAATRIATGEKLELPAEFLQFMMNEAIDVIHPDIAFVGGITGMRKIADLAELFYVPIVTHNAGSFVQLLATAHFGASARNFVMTESRRPEDDMYPEMNESGIRITDGKMAVPTAPGLGLTLDEDYLKSKLDEGEVWTW
jgi:L-alanine-DL-glutamate epimerase-like enolase superfamily enzyme